MKRLILILLCLPLFVFSQEERTYGKTMSISQFVRELEDAGNKGNNYILEDCHITYDSIYDMRFFKQGDKFSGEAVIENIHFTDSTFVDITNCKFGKSEKNYDPTLTFKNCDFGQLDFNFDKGESQEFAVSQTNRNVKTEKIIGLYFDNITADVLSVKCSNRYKLDIEITNSKINYCNIDNAFNNGGKDLAGWMASIKIDSNVINHICIWSVEVLQITRNILTYVQILGDIANCDIEQNVFNSSFNNTWLIEQPPVFNGGIYTASKDEFRIDNRLGLYISAKTGSINCLNNLFNKFPEEEILSSDSILKLLKKFAVHTGAPGSLAGYYPDDTSSFNELKNDLGTEEGIIAQLNFLEKKLQRNDSLNLNYQKGPYLAITGESIGSINLKDNKIYTLFIRNNTIKNKLKIEKLKVDGYINISSNNLPDYNSVFFDSTVINFGFSYKKSIYYGNESYKDISTNLNDNDYQNKLNSLLSQYRFLIKIYKTHGSPFINSCIYKLKDIETSIKEYEYYRNPNTQKWFNWKGAQFLKWYSDYGMNPFKALTYCFWAMLYFALFYFFFYSEWDKIDRGFLIKRFNSVMDYFTTEKRIEDFYSTVHDKEMTTFTEFKDTLDKNKVYMPGMLASLAKPIYQISLLRYRLLNFSYKKAEFMAGRKWVDLEKKDRYWIGALTFFLTLTYIIYLIFIRALNSIVLSINAFSTLGFGTIPVRGVTKYVAIIEGFIGWFMLSVFIVSLLGQMMSV